MLVNTNTKQKLITQIEQARGEIKATDYLTLMLDAAVAAKALTNEDRGLLLASNDTDTLAEKLTASFSSANLANLDAKIIAKQIMSVDESHRKQLISFTLNEVSLDASYAEALKGLLLTSYKYFEGVGIPSPLTELLSEIVNPKKQNLQLALCGNNSDEYALAATKHSEVTQLPLEDDHNLQTHFKLLFLSGRSMKSLSDTDGSVFHQDLQFDAAILSDPFGVRAYKPLLASHKYKRLSSELVQAEALIKRVNGRVACLVRTGLLSMTSGDDAQFKQDLLKLGLLEGVIQLPERLLTATAIPVAVLVINTKERFDKVTMINAQGPEFYTDLNRSDREFTNSEAVMDMLIGKPSPYSEVVSVEEVLNESANIQVTRYIKTEKQKAVADRLSNYETVRLQDIADVQVCQMIKSVPDDELIDESLSVKQISPQDINRLGQINSQSVRTIYPIGQEKRVNSQRVLNGDILFSAKGVIGVCGLVDKATDGMVSNQSFFIIRMRKNPYFVSPKALFLYLQSDLCQTSLEPLVTGSAMKAIKTQDIKVLKVPIIKPEEQDNLAQAYQSLVALDEQRQALEEKIDAGLNQIWPV